MSKTSLLQSASRNLRNHIAPILGAFFTILLCAAGPSGYAAVTVTPAAGGDICSTTATSAHTLDTITITEGATTDFPSGSSSITLTPPTGWSFIVALPTISATGGDVAIGVFSITAGSLTINFNASGTTHMDVITITNLQVKAASSGSATGNIFASTSFGVTGIATGSTGTNFGTLSIVPAVIPLVTISPSPSDTICTGASVTFTPAPINGGATPTFEWFVNGSFVGSGSTFSSSTLVSGNTVYATMISSASCLTAASAISNNVIMTTIAPPAAVTATGGGTFCTNATLAASNGGSGTIYFQGTISGGTSKLLGGTPQTVTSSGTYYFNANSGGGCWGTEGSVVATVNPVATANAGTPQTVCTGDTITLAGTVGGSATGATWSAPTGTFSNPASLTSRYTAATVAGPVTLTLTTSGPCASVVSTVAITVNDCSSAVPGISAADDIHVYPNPATSSISIDAPAAVNIAVISSVGKIMLEQKHTAKVDVSGLAEGIYMLMIYDEYGGLRKTEKFAKIK